MKDPDLTKDVTTDLANGYLTQACGTNRKELQTFRIYEEGTLKEACILDTIRPEGSNALNIIKPRWKRRCPNR